MLAQAAAFVRPGGVLAYATCSLLPPENDERIAAFRAGASRVPSASDAAGLERSAAEARRRLRARSRRTRFSFLRVARGTDGFFLSLLRRDG